MSRARESAFVAAVLAVYLVLALSAAATHAPTFDETVYLPAGYAAVAAADFRINTVHPPLAKMVAALPLRAMDVRLDRADPAWVEGHAWKFGHRFLYLWNDADRLLFAGRAAMTTLALLMAVLVHLWTRRHWGRIAAAAALVFTAFSPDVLAHGALVTNDLAIACFFFAAVVAFERVTERPAALRILAAGLATGAALLSKHSALLLAVLLPALAVASGLTRRHEAPARRREAAAIVGALLAVAVLAWVVVWAGYHFRFAAAADPTTTGTLTWRTPSGGAVDGAARFLAAHRGLPEAYAHGLADLASRAQSRRAFLLGRYSSEGWWYYFPVAFALKTPLPLIVLLSVALTLLPRGLRAPAWFLWLPPAVFVAASLTTHVNIGFRYWLPVLPFAFVAAGRATAWLWETGRRGRAAAALLVAWYAGGALFTHPHHLSYFNDLAGGPYGGYRHLVDSNVDWGQDLKRLRIFMDEAKVDRVRLSYFGTAPPERYGIRHALLPSVMRPFPERFLVHVGRGDVVVVSATNLQGLYLPRVVRPLMERLEALVPMARVGPSLFVYRSDFHWLLRPERAEEVGWLPQAIASYRECLAEHPEHRTQAREFLEAAQARGAPASPASDGGSDEPDEPDETPAAP